MSGKQKHPKNKEKSWIRLVAEPQLENEIDEMETAVEDHARESARRRRHAVWGNRTLWFVALTAIAIALSYVVLLRMPEGGDVTFLSMLVVCLIGYILGPAEGICGAAIFGLIKYFIDYGMVQTNFAELCDYLVWNYLYFYPAAGMSFAQQLKEAVVYCSIYIFPELVFSLAVLSIPAVMNAIQFLRIMANEDYAERYDYY